MPVRAKVVLIAALLVAGCSPNVARTSARGVDTNGRVLLDTLHHSRGASYHATYRVFDHVPPSRVTTIDVYRHQGMIREDTWEPGQSLEMRTRTISANGQVVHCTKLDVYAWDCRYVTSTAPGLGSMEEEVFRLVDGNAVDVSRDTIAGENVDCFVIDAAPEPSVEVCIPSDGIPSRVRSQTRTIELTSVDRTFADPAEFDPPVPPTGP